MMSKHIVCYSGGVSSALVGAMVINKFGRENTIFLNHVVSAEPDDVARFEEEFAEFHGMEITYANGDTDRYPNLSPIDVIKREKAFAIGGLGGNVLCTHRLKTEPFYNWLKQHYREGDVIYYGFDKGEEHRMQRRSTLLAKDGYRTDFPLALWDNPLDKSYLELIGIKPPMQYKVFKHANCRGCIKAKKQHWLCIYVHDRATFDEFAALEEEIGHSILPDVYLEELRDYFNLCSKSGIEITEHTQFQTFWAQIKRRLKEIGAKYDEDLFNAGLEEGEALPCECLV